MTEERFYPLGRYLKKVFGERVHKISVQIPTAGIVEGGYSLCAGGTVAAPPDEQMVSSVTDQISAAKERIRLRFKFGKFIVHLHAAQGVRTSLDAIRAAVDEILLDNEVIGLNVTTRPYCLTPEMTRFLRDTSRQVFTWLEVGVHSIHDETLKRIGMRLTWAEVRDRVMSLRATRMHLAPHVVFGLPGETPEMVRRTMEEISRLGFDGINIHHFYVLKGGRFEKEFMDGALPLLTREQYVEMVCDSIEMLPPEMVLHRIVGEAQDDRLLGPDWTRMKKENLDLVSVELERRGTAQGCRFNEMATPPAPAVNG